MSNSNSLETPEIKITEETSFVENSLKLTNDDLPNNMQFAFEPLSGKLENICADIHSMVNMFLLTQTII